MRYQRLINLFAIIGGGGTALIGALLLAIAASGNVNEGQTGLAISGIGLLLVAAPAIAAPFSARIAKWLLLLALACFAVLTIRLTFWPQAGVTPTPPVQRAVIAFAALLVLRVFVGRRGKRTDLGT